MDLTKEDALAIAELMKDIKPMTENDLNAARVKWDKEHKNSRSNPEEFPYFERVEKGYMRRFFGRLKKEKQ